MRVVLKDMKLGIGENTILRVFHKDAVEWYNITSDLKTGMQRSACMDGSSP